MPRELLSKRDWSDRDPNGFKGKTVVFANGDFRELIFHSEPKGGVLATVVRMTVRGAVGDQLAPELQITISIAPPNFEELERSAELHLTQSEAAHLLQWPCDQLEAIAAEAAEGMSEAHEIASSIFAKCSQAQREAAAASSLGEIVSDHSLLDELGHQQADNVAEALQTMAVAAIRRRRSKEKRAERMYRLLKSLMRCGLGDNEPVQDLIAEIDAEIAGGGDAKR